MPSKSSISKSGKRAGNPDVSFRLEATPYPPEKMSFHHAEKLCTSNNVTLYQLFVKPSFFLSKQSTLSCQLFGFFCLFLELILH